MELSSIKYLNFLKQFVRNERATKVFSSTTMMLSVSLSRSVRLRHLAVIAQQKLKEFNKKKPHLIPLCLVGVSHLVCVKERPDLHTPLQ